MALAPEASGQLAKIVTTLDVLSGGRAMRGTRLGAHPEQAAAPETSPADRPSSIGVDLRGV
jgi:hypothetical protein